MVKGKRSPSKREVDRQPTTSGSANSNTASTATQSSHGTNRSSAGQASTTTQGTNVIPPNRAPEVTTSVPTDGIVPLRTPAQPSAVPSASNVPDTPLARVAGSSNPAPGSRRIPPRSSSTNTRYPHATTTATTTTDGDTVRDTRRRMDGPVPANRRNDLSSQQVPQMSQARRDQFNISQSSGRSSNTTTPNTPLEGVASSTFATGLPRRIPPSLTVAPLHQTALSPSMSGTRLSSNGRTSSSAGCFAPASSTSSQEKSPGPAVAPTFTGNTQSVWRERPPGYDYGGRLPSFMSTTRQLPARTTGSQPSRTGHNVSTVAPVHHAAPAPSVSATRLSTDRRTLSSAGCFAPASSTSAETSPRPTVTLSFTGNTQGVWHEPPPPPINYGRSPPSFQSNDRHPIDYYNYMDGEKFKEHLPLFVIPTAYLEFKRQKALENEMKHRQDFGHMLFQQQHNQQQQYPPYWSHASTPSSLQRDVFGSFTDNLRLPVQSGTCCPHGNNVAYCPHFECLHARIRSGSGSTMGGPSAPQSPRNVGGSAVGTSTNLPGPQGHRPFDVTVPANNERGQVSRARTSPVCTSSISVPPHQQPPQPPHIQVVRSPRQVSRASTSPVCTSSISVPPHQQPPQPPHIQVVRSPRQVSRARTSPVCTSSISVPPHQQPPQPPHIQVVRSPRQVSRASTSPVCTSSISVPPHQQPPQPPHIQVVRSPRQVSRARTSPVCTSSISVPPHQQPPQPPHIQVVRSPRQSPSIGTHELPSGPRQSAEIVTLSDDELPAEESSSKLPTATVLANVPSRSAPEDPTRLHFHSDRVDLDDDVCFEGIWKSTTDPRNRRRRRCVLPDAQSTSNQESALLDVSYESSVDSDPTIRRIIVDSEPSDDEYEEGEAGGDSDGSNAHPEEPEPKRRRPDDY